MRFATFLVFMVCLTGCDQIAQQMNPPEPTPPPQPNAVKAEPQRPPVVKVVDKPVEPEPQPVPTVEPQPQPKPEPVMPRSSGIVQRTATPKRVRGATGVEFLLVVRLDGDEFDTYQYQTVMSDEDGNTKTVPMRISGETAVMDEFIPRAGVGQTFSFQVKYIDPADMQEGNLDGFSKGVFKFAN